MVKKPDNTRNLVVKGALIGTALYMALQSTLYFVGKTLTRQEAARPAVERDFEQHVVSPRRDRFAELDRIFEMYDTDKDGKLSRYEAINLIGDNIQKGE